MEAIRRYLCKPQRTDSDEVAVPIRYRPERELVPCRLASPRQRSDHVLHPLSPSGHTVSVKSSLTYSKIIILVGSGWARRSRARIRATSWHRLTARLLIGHAGGLELRLDGRRTAANLAVVRPVEDVLG